MRVMVTGGTGFIGRHLTAKLLAGGHDVSLLTRSPRQQRLPSISWDNPALDQWLGEQDAVVHLAGRSIFTRRWSAAEKERIRRSRLDTTRRLVEAMSLADRRPGVLISSSAIYYYGTDSSETDHDEESAAGRGFVGKLCRDWEAAAEQAEDLGVRTVLLRIGICLAKDSLALEGLVPLVKYFMFGTSGSGRQWLSWIHIEDLVGLIGRALSDPGLTGPYNAVAPEPVRLERMTRTLGEMLGRPALLPIPDAFARGFLGEASEIVLKGLKASPRRALDAGFEFRFPELDQALRDILS